jgi:hypothetical protein
MRSVIVKSPRSVDFANEMSQMRSWLDTQGCSPSRFQYYTQGDAVIIEVEFGSNQEAEAFKRRFDGVEGVLIKGGRPAYRETIEQVCWWRLTAEEIRSEADGFGSRDARETMAQVALSYDRMAEDLERRLTNPRYRDGLLVG